MQRPLIACIFVIFLVLTPAAGAIHLFEPRSNLVSSDRVKDVVAAPEGHLVFATENGLSIYWPDNQTWKILHTNHDNFSEGLMANFIVAVEYDHMGRLWLGYGGGLQIQSAGYYEVIDDQQLLKNRNVNDIQRRDKEMWVATGHAGLHRVVNGTWSWYKPYGPGGLDAYEIRRLAVEPRTGSLVAVSNGEGVLISKDDSADPYFEEVMYHGAPLKQITGAVADSSRGVYLFNSSTVMIMYEQHLLQHLFTVDDLGVLDNHINDIAALPGGVLLIATDTGIFGWKAGEIQFHLTRADGIGGIVVRFLSPDPHGRVWYTVQGLVGYLDPGDYLPAGATKAGEIEVRLTGPVTEGTTATLPAEAAITPVTDASPGDAGSTGTDQDVSFFAGLQKILFSSPQDLLEGGGEPGTSATVTDTSWVGQITGILSTPVQDIIAQVRALFLPSG